MRRETGRKGFELFIGSIHGYSYILFFAVDDDPGGENKTHFRPPPYLA
jgi:hypothetical protein